MADVGLGIHHLGAFPGDGVGVDNRKAGTRSVSDEDDAGRKN